MNEIAQATYWIGTEFTGRSIGTQALNEFLDIDSTRPMQARTAFDNLASIRVLEKNGFSQIGEDIFFANARGLEVRELIWQLA